MKKLILVRHAKASYENTFLQDYDRPLQKSGIEDIKQIGQYLKFKKHNLNKVISACVVAQKQTSNNFNIDEAKKYCEKEIKSRMNK